MPRTIKADGRTITVPDDATPDEINQIVGPAPKAPDTRNAIQRGFDNLTTVTPEQDATTPGFLKPIAHFGAGVIQGIGSPLIHPEQTAEGIGHLFTHPQDTAAQAGDMFENDPAKTIGATLGGAGFGAAAGELLPAGVRAASEPMQRGGGGLIEHAAGALKSDFAHGAQPGEAYLEGGGTPALTMRGLANKAEAVKNNAGQTLGEAYDAASAPAPRAPVRALLQAPQYDVPLASSGEINPRMSPMAFPAKMRNVTSSDLPEAGDIPGAKAESGTPAMGSGGRFSYGVPNPEYLSGSAHPELSGKVAVPQGVLRTRDPAIAGSVMSPEPIGAPFPVGATRIPGSDVQSALLGPVNRLRGIQNGPGGVGASPLLDEYESGIRGSTEQDFTPRSLFDLKRNVAANTRWNDPTMFDMNSVRQQGVGGISKLLTDAVPETAPLNRIYQGAGNLAERAGTRADTGTPPFTSLVNRGLEGAAGVGLGYATHNPFLAAAPLLMDSVPVKTATGYLLYHGGRAAGAVPNLGVPGAVAGATAPLLQGAQ